jgi:hypothetical protein
MTRGICCAFVAAAIGAGPFLVGCDETVSRESTTKVKDDGTVVKTEEKVTQGADGSVTKTEKKTVDKPDNDRDGASIKVDVDK